MIRRVSPGSLCGTARVPPSKSHMQRLLLCAALSGMRTEIACRGALPGDCRALIDCLPALGAAARISLSGVIVTPSSRGARVFPCGESGAVLRFLLPVCAATGGGEIAYTGRERPTEALVAALAARGATIERAAGAYTVGGRLDGGAFTLAGDISSQFVSGLLFALPLLSGDSEIILTSPLVSAGYVDMTLDALAAFGVAAEPRAGGFFVPGGQRYVSPGYAACEGDCSAGAVWRAAAAMGHRVTVSGMPDATRQPDAAIDSFLSRTEIDVSGAPDLMPLLAAVAAAKKGVTTRICGTARLSGKESDRPRAMAAALGALGIDCERGADCLIVHGGSPRGGAVSGARDHRVVMALALLATVAESPVEISDAEAVGKSYPSFWNDFDRLSEGNA